MDPGEDPILAAIELLDRAERLDREAEELESRSAVTEEVAGRIEELQCEASELQWQARCLQSQSRVFDYEEPRNREYYEPNPHNVNPGRLGAPGRYRSGGNPGPWR